ncbi:MAG: DnaJ C-terminal domain-containing protein, partial [Planctomycetota bacterium]
MAQDYYDILCVSRSADPEIIEKAYRLLAKRYHPDRVSSRDAQVMFRLIQEAYDVLNSPRRRLYDQGLLKARHGQTAGSVGSTIYQLLPLRLEQAIKGGRVPVSRMTTHGPQRLDVQVPPGVEDGALIRVAGQGDPSPNGGPPGDLILILAIQPDSRLRRERLDLYVQTPIPLQMAVEGGQTAVKVLDQTIPVTVPPRSNTGDRVRVRAAGLKNQKGQHGDLYAVLNITVDHDAAPAAPNGSNGSTSIPGPTPPVLRQIEA